MVQCAQTFTLNVKHYVDETELCNISETDFYHLGHALITADSLGMHAFDLETQQMLWTTGSMLPQCEQAMHLRSVASNDRGLLFAVDEFNICVHMFAARDGRYCGCLIRADSPWGDRPLYVNWCENTSSLTVFHQKGREKKISFLEIPY